MARNFLTNNSQILTRPQKTILSAATIIMVMIAASRILGLLRNRILAHYFSTELLAVYFAAFRLPEIVFEILVFGTLTSAFIPTFASYFSNKKETEAWYVASASLNISLAIFSFFTILVFIFARPLYHLIAPGFSAVQLEQTILLARILIFTQAFFLLSYFLTAVLESLKRFLIPAIAPLFYNLGIILGTIFFTKNLGIIAPAVGAILGSIMHFLIQVPLARHLGFRFQWRWDFRHPGVRKIGRLALPRMVELSFLEISKSVELYLASLIGASAYTYLTFANTLQLLPVSLFGVSIAKASLPSLAYQAERKDKFKEIFLSSFNQILFLTLPIAVFLAVLRIPIIRLLFGAPRFGWQSTVQTSLVLSAYCLGIPSQSLIFLLNRAFYALHDTITPMAVSIGATFLYALMGLVIILVLKFPVWGLALVFSLTSLFQFLLLLLLIYKRKISFSWLEFLKPVVKIFSAATISGGLMFVFLKILDRSVWEKQLSFLGKLGLTLPTAFKFFILDTRYTINLIMITLVVGLLGGLAYLFFCWQLRLKEVFVLFKLLARVEKLLPLSRLFTKKKESVTIDSSSHID